MTGAKFPKLTARQQKVLDFIVERQRADGVSPSTREIQKAPNLSSQNSAVQFLHALWRKGAIRTLEGKARGVALISQPVQIQACRDDGRSLFIDVPIQGEVTAGLPVDAPARIGDVLPVHAASMSLTTASRPFALRVRGDSMTGVYIQNGDYVVLDAACEPRSGDVVVALLDGESTLKRLVTAGGRFSLKSENPAYPEIKPARDLRVQGDMVGLVRGTADKLTVA